MHVDACLSRRGVCLCVSTVSLSLFMHFLHALQYLLVGPLGRCAAEELHNNRYRSHTGVVPLLTISACCQRVFERNRENAPILKQPN